MIDLPPVSVITAAYNAASTLAETLESLLAQTSPHWEAIVVDDGSSDATFAIAQSFAERDGRIRAFRQPHAGASSARNAGIGQARHDWLLFLDADDWIAPAHLSRLNSELVAHPQLDAVHCGSVRVASDGTHVMDDYFPPPGDLFPILARRSAFTINSCIVRRAVVEAAGRFDSSLRKCEDWDLWQRVARMGTPFGAVREVLAFYRMSQNSSSLDAEQSLRDGLTVLRRGHATDSRVAHPHPDWVCGLVDQPVESQVFYLLCWSAGLLLGARKDARGLLAMVRDYRYTRLDSSAIAKCIYDAGTLPMSQSRDVWGSLFLQIAQEIEWFLTALEEQSQTPGLAGGALLKLQERILKDSSLGKAVIAELESTRLEVELWRSGKAELERELEQERQRKAALESELQEERQRKAALESELQEERQRKAALESELQEERQRKAALESELREERQRKAALEGELREERQRNAALEGELQVERQRKTTLESELREERHQRETSVRDMSHEIALLEESLEQERVQSDALSSGKLFLEAELRRWRISAEDHGRVLEQLRKHHWIRLGEGFGVLKEAALQCEEGPDRALAEPQDAGPRLPAPIAFSGQPGTDCEWQLSVAPGNTAVLRLASGHPDAVRVEISRASSPSRWSIQINRAGLQVHAGGSYVLEFQGRADRPRSIGVGIAKAGSPWTNLGFYTELRLIPEWRNYRMEVTIAEGDENARIHFDLGTRNIAVELSGVDLHTAR